MKSKFIFLLVLSSILSACATTSAPKLNNMENYQSMNCSALQSELNAVHARQQHLNQSADSEDNQSTFVNILGGLMAAYGAYIGDTSSAQMIASSTTDYQNASQSNKQNHTDEANALNGRTQLINKIMQIKKCN